MNGGAPEPMEPADPAAARLASEHKALHHQAETLLASISETCDRLGMEGNEIAGYALTLLFSDERELLDVLRMDPRSCEEMLSHERWRAPLQRLRSHAVHQLEEDEEQRPTEASSEPGTNGNEHQARIALAACNRLLGRP